jgi:hypothetical protein
MGDDGSKRCNWHTLTQPMKNKNVFLAKLSFLLSFLREFNEFNELNEFNEVHVIHKFTIFGGFLRRLVYELFAVIDQNAKPGDTDLKEGTFQGGKSDIDIYGDRKYFEKLIGLRKGFEYTTFKHFLISRIKKKDAYQNGFVTTYSVSFENCITMTTVVFFIDIVDPDIKLMQYFNVNCLEYKLEKILDLYNVFFFGCHKNEQFASIFLNNLELNSNFNCKNYNYHCRYHALCSIFGCIRDREAIARFNTEEYLLMSSAHQEIEKYVARGKKLESEGWFFRNFNLKGAGRPMFPEKSNSPVSAQMWEFPGYVITCPTMHRDFQGLPPILRDIILSYITCTCCVVRNDAICADLGDSSEGYATSSDEEHCGY